MRTCQFVLAAVLALFLASPAHAATYTVKAGGGGTYTTIQACATAMAAGDTCVVYAGTYGQVVTVPAGTPGNYKSIVANTGDTVYVWGFTLNSYTRVIGFQIQRPSSPAANSCVDIAANAEYVYITSNSMYACGGLGMISEHMSVANTRYIFIQGNTLSYSKSTSSAPNVGEGMYLNGDYHLIENNDISHVSDGITLFGSHNVVRNNTFHDATDSDCGGNSSNCHIDFIESEPVVANGLTRPNQYSLYEGNIVRTHRGANSHVFLAQADACSGQCYGIIARFNDLAQVGSYGFLDDNTGFTKVKIYNNTWVDFGVDILIGHQAGGTQGAEINNLFYWPASSGTYFPYYVDSASASGYTAASNLAACAGTCTFLDRHDSGSFVSDAIGNQVAKPLFVNYASNNFRLSAGSPAIGAGAALTTVAAGDSGTGTSLIVTDAAFFSDGYGLVNADWIRIGASTAAEIRSIDYSTNTITLTSSVSRSPGDPIYLYRISSGSVVLYGSKPDIGAYPLAAPAPPTNVSVR